MASNCLSLSPSLPTIPPLSPFCESLSSLIGIYVLRIFSCRKICSPLLIPALGRNLSCIASPISIPYPIWTIKGEEFAAPSFWWGWISGGGRDEKPGSLLPWVDCSSPTIWLRIVRGNDDLILSCLRVHYPWRRSGPRSEWCGCTLVEKGRGMTRWRLHLSISKYASQN